jgi:Holliday junction resolvase RusA-like endonuclease
VRQDSKGKEMTAEVGPCAFCNLAVERPALLCSTCSAPWQCWLPWAPGTNNLFINISEERRAIIRAGMRRKGKKGEPPTRAMSSRYRKWRDEAVIRIRSNWRSRPPWPVPVVIKLELIPPDRRPRDADGHNKAVIDALVEARVLVDDNNRHVKAVLPFWAEAQKNAGVIVTIRPARIEAPKRAQGELFATT